MILDDKIMDKLRDGYALTMNETRTVYEYVLNSVSKEELKKEELKSREDLRKPDFDNGSLIRDLMSIVIKINTGKYAKKASYFKKKGY